MIIILNCTAKLQNLVTTHDHKTNSVRLQNPTLHKEKETNLLYLRRI